MRSFSVGAAAAAGYSITAGSTTTTNQFVSLGLTTYLSRSSKAYIFIPMLLTLKHSVNSGQCHIALIVTQNADGTGNNSGIVFGTMTLHATAGNWLPFTSTAVGDLNTLVALGFQPGVPHGIEVLVSNLTAGTLSWGDNTYNSTNYDQLGYFVLGGLQP